jgi:hypothetical protein
MREGAAHAHANTHAHGGDRLKMDGTSGRVEEICLEHAEKNEARALWTPQHDSEHPGRQDGNTLALAVDDTRPTSDRLSRLDVGGLSSSDKYAMDSKMAITEVTHHETVDDPISPKTVIQPIGTEKKAIAIDDQISAPSVLKKTPDDASGTDAPPIKADPVVMTTTDSSDGPPQLGPVLAFTSTSNTDSGPIESSQVSSASQPASSASIPAPKAPVKTKAAVGGDTIPPLDVLVVDDDK